MPANYYYTHTIHNNIYIHVYTCLYSMEENASTLADTIVLSWYDTIESESIHIPFTVVGIFTVVM